MTEKIVNIDLPTDETGMLARQCPNCDGQFAVHGESYQQEYYLNLRCPYCELISEFDEFLTTEQAEYAESVAENEARRMLEDEVVEAFEDAFSGTGSSDFIEVETNTDDVDLGHRNTLSPHLNIETNQVVCSDCEFPFVIKEDTVDHSCPVCR